MIPTLAVVFALYLLCHVGDTLTQRYEGLRSITYNLDWYLYPLNTQKNMQMIMILAEKKVYLKGFGGIGCDRNVFKKV